MLKDLDIIQKKRDSKGQVYKKDGSIVYEVAPLLKHISDSYFRNPTKIPIKHRKITGKVRHTSSGSIRIPQEQEILDICSSGEDQLYEFKRAGVEIKKLTKEVSAFANTSTGGLIFYGVEDDGSVTGSDMRKQDLDQPLQNSINNNISPALMVRIVEKEVVGFKILLIVIPPRPQKEVYHYDGRVYIRKGTNVIGAKVEETKKMYNGQHII